MGKNKMNLQTHCHWCCEPIYAERVFDVKTFWNQGFIGYPICDKCSDGLQTDGKPPMEILRKKLGLKPDYNPQKSMEKWI